jgi:hypothetical protein
MGVYLCMQNEQNKTQEFTNLRGVSLKISELSLKQREQGLTLLNTEQRELEVLSNCNCY